MPRMKWKRTVLLVLLLAAAGVCVWIAWLYVAFHRQAGAGHCSNGPNAVWARHMWAGEPHSLKEYRDFFSTIKRNHITDIYFHVGPWLDADGGIPENKYAHAGELLAAAQRLAPDIRLHAWIGQMTKQGGGPLDLHDKNTRRRIVASASKFLDVGFHGIHYDFEPVYSGDKGYIDLLKQTEKIVKSRKKYLSVATGQLELVPGSKRLFRIIAPKASIWSVDYFTEVAAHTDQVAVMMYDTALPADWLYGMYVKKQTQKLVPLLRGKTTLFFGVPSYEDNRPGHRPWAENVRTGVRGVQLGLASVPAIAREDVGLAVFAAWTTDAREWSAFRRGWLCEK